MRTIAVANQKGGVGKTTTAANLGACLAMAGHTVLCVDLDPQACLTPCLGIEAPASTIGQALQGEKLQAVATPVHPKLVLLPTNSGLAQVEKWIEAQPVHREYLLRDLLQEQADSEYVVIDCPPGRGLLTINALVAAELVIIPVPDHLAMTKAVEWLPDVRAVQKHANPGLQFRLLVTLADRDRHTRAIEEGLRERYGEQVFECVVPRRSAFKNAAVLGCPLSVLQRESAGALAYQALAVEVRKALGD